jgi:hypothetical protein
MSLFGSVRMINAIGRHIEEIVRRQQLSQLNRFIALPREYKRDFPSRQMSRLMTEIEPSLERLENCIVTIGKMAAFSGSRMPVSGS